MSVEIEEVADQPVKEEPEKAGDEENVEKKTMLAEFSARITGGNCRKEPKQ